MGNPNPSYRFQKGQSGNPGGRKKTPPEIREMAKIAAPDAMRRAIDELKNPDAKVALRAVEIVLDRAYGKPTQPVDGDGEGGPIDMNVTVRFIKPQKE